MEHIVQVVETEELLENYRELLQTVDILPLRVSGNSMTPFLVHGRDTVYLSRMSGPLKVGDMVLYRRKSGDYILHRICRLEDGAYCMVGDAQNVLEHGIERGQIFAVVRWVQRKGKRQAPGSFWWVFFEKAWVRMVPWRPMIIRLYGTICRCIGRKHT